MMDSITFNVDDVTIQLVNDTVLFWHGMPDHDPDISIALSDLKNALSTSHMLIKEVQK